jgi:hypothetical protein
VLIVDRIANSKDASEHKFLLKGDYVDLHSCKVQMIFAGAAVLLISLISWSAALSTGFLLDDYLHLDYLNRAVHGDYQDFLANFSSNWGGSDLMKSYRPLVSLSLMADFLVWGANAAGFHLTNLLLLALSSLLVGLITLELSGLRGNRLSAVASIWSALLFCVYPLHLEAGVWVIGRVDLLCTFFYLASLFCYLRFRLIREKPYFHFSLAFFAAAMLSKEMAVTLPLVVTAAELLLYPLWRERATPEFAAALKLRRLTAVLSFWFVLGFLATWRLVVLHELIGGYGNPATPAAGNFKTALTNYAGNFLNGRTWSRIFFPVNLDLLSRVGLQSAWDLRETLEKVLKISYIAVALCGIARLLCRSASLRILAFLAFWLSVGLLPTYQIWAVSPNLVGSRLFFLSSAPFVILIAFLALPAIDALSARLVKVFACAGTLALLVILSIWSCWLQFDLEAWTGASQSLQAFRGQVLQILAGLDRESRRQGKSILILNLPTDYSGAGMLTRAQYLRFMLRPPFCRQDYGSRVYTLDPTDRQWPGPVHAEKQQKAAPQNYNYAAALKELLLRDSLAGVFVWKDAGTGTDTGFLSKWPGPKTGAAGHLLFGFNARDLKISVEPARNAANCLQLNLDRAEALPLSSRNEWTIEKDGGRLFQIPASGSGLQVRPGNKDVLLIFACPPISPLEAGTAELETRTVSGQAPPLCFMWSATGLGQTPASGSRNYAFAGQHCRRIWHDFFTLPFPPQERAVLALNQYRDWAQTPVINTLAIKLPAGDYEIELRQLELK